MNRLAIITIALVSLSGTVHAEEPAPKRPALPPIVSLSVQPAALTLDDARDARTVIVTGNRLLVETAVSSTGVDPATGPGLLTVNVVGSDDDHVTGRFDTVLPNVSVMVAVTDVVSCKPKELLTLSVVALALGVTVAT